MDWIDHAERAMTQLPGWAVWSDLRPEYPMPVLVYGYLYPHVLLPQPQLYSYVVLPK